MDLSADRPLIENGAWSETISLGHALSWKKAQSILSNCDTRNEITRTDYR